MLTRLLLNTMVLTEHQSFLMADLDGRLWRREVSKRETLLEKALI
jgi:hypothetical protein